MYALQNVVYHFVLFLLAIVLSILLGFPDSDYLILYLQTQVINGVINLKKTVLKDIFAVSKHAIFKWIISYISIHDNTAKDALGYTVFICYIHKSCILIYILKRWLDS